MANTLVTIADVTTMQAMTGTVDATNVYYLMELGKEGPFYYDPTDTTTPQNIGTVIVAGTNRFKRTYDPATVLVSWFGTDGVAIQAALDTGTNFVEFEARKTYYTNAQLLMTTNRQTVVGNGATLKQGSLYEEKDSSALIGVPETVLIYKNGQTISVSADSNTFTFVYNNLSNPLIVGNIVCLQNSNTAYYISGTNSYYYGWYGVITNIAGDTVTLSTCATDTFIADIFVMYDTKTDICIQGLNVDMRGSHNGFGIAFHNCINSKVSFCSLQSDNIATCAVIGIYATGVNLEIANNMVSGFRFVPDGPGYDIAIDGINILVQQNDLSGAKHAITVGGRLYMSQGINIINNTVSGGASARIDFHGNMRGGSIRDNRVYVSSGSLGIENRGYNVVIDNNLIVINHPGSNNVSGIVLYELGGTNCAITNNKVYCNGTTGANVAIDIFSVGVTINNLTIENNYLEGDVVFENDCVGLGSQIKIYSNLFSGTSSRQARLNIATPVVAEYYIVGNTFINMIPTAFTYCINVGYVGVVNGYIRDNVLKMADGNTSFALRLYSSRNDISGNKIFTSSTTPITGGATNNVYTSNWLINPSGAYTPLVNDPTFAQTTLNGSSGYAVFSQPERNVGWKKVIIYCNSLSGSTSAYTFPVPFLNTPAVVTTNGLASSIVTATTTTAIVTGSASTGFLILEGY